MSHPHHPRLPRSLLQQEYDPSLVYIPKDKALKPPSHITDVYDWIERLINLNNENYSQKSGSIPTIQSLIQCMQNYDVIFSEISKQMTKYSEKMSSLHIQSWKSVMQLMECVIKAFHRHTKETKYIQEEAANVLIKSKEKESEARRNMEQFSFEKASLKARTRNLESEIESLSTANRVLRRENEELRRTVSVFLCSGEEYKFDHKSPDLSTNEEEHIDLNHSLEFNDFSLISKIDVDLNKSLDESLLEINKSYNLILQFEEQYNNSLSLSPVHNSHGNARIGGNISTSVAYYGQRLVVDIGVQVDEKDELGLLDPAFENQAYILNIAKKDVFPHIPWEELSHPPLQPSSLEALISKKYRVKRIPSLEWTHQLIYAIYTEKVLLDQTSEDSNALRPSLSHFIYNGFFAQRYNLQTAIDAQTTLLLTAVDKYAEVSVRVRLFSRIIGLNIAKYSTDPLDTTDCYIMLKTFAAIHSSDLLIEDPKLKQPIIPLSFAYELAEQMLGSWSIEAVQECSKGIRTLETCGPKDSYLLIDEILVVFADSWRSARTLWEDHIRYIAKKNCSLYRVNSELSYARDMEEGEFGETHLFEAKDTELMRIQDKYDATDSMRRPVRVFDIQHTRINSAREVVELLQPKEFYYSCLTMFPNISDEEVDSMFHFACESITTRSLRACVDEGGWRELQLLNGRVVYANVNRKRVQWKKPFEKSSFRDSSSCDIDTFISVALQQNLLLRGPYSRFLSLKPEDFWPHAETFLKQNADDFM